MKKLLKAVGFTALMAGLYFLVSILVGIGIAVILVIKMMVIDKIVDMNNMEELVLNGLGDWMIPMLLLINIITLAVIMLIFLARKDKFFTYIALRKFKLSDALLIGILGVFFNILIVGLVTISADILPIQDKMEQYQALMEPLMNSPFPLVFLVVSVSAPLFEETIFRGIVLNDFKKVVPVWLAVVIQGVLFGVFHMNWIQGVYASVLGIVLGVICLKYKSIWAPIIMHFTYNTTSFLLDIVFKEDTSMLLISAIGLIGSAVMVFILYIVYDRDQYKDVEETLIHGAENISALDSISE